MICPSCGKTILDTSTFCPFCGVKTVVEATQTAAQPAAEPEQPAYQQADYRGEYHNSYQQPQQNYQQYAPYQEQAPETTKPRSAYWAAVLHLLAGYLGLGYYYRGMKDKAKNCIILFVVGLLTSWIFGLGAIAVLVCQIINIVEAVKLFRGDYPVDAYGRTLYQEF